MAYLKKTFVMALFTGLFFICILYFTLLGGDLVIGGDLGYSTTTEVPSVSTEVGFSKTSIVFFKKDTLK